MANKLGSCNYSKIRSNQEKCKESCQANFLPEEKSHCKPLFAKLKLLAFDQYYQLSTAKFMWNLSNDQLPLSICSMFKRNVTSISGHESDFVLPTITTELKRRFMSFNDVKIWKKSQMT